MSLGSLPKGQALEDFIMMLSLAGPGDTCHMSPKWLGKGDFDSHTTITPRVMEVVTLPGPKPASFWGLGTLCSLLSLLQALTLLAWSAFLPAFQGSVLFRVTLLIINTTEHSG